MQAGKFPLRFLRRIGREQCERTFGDAPSLEPEVARPRSRCRVCGSDSVQRSIAVPLRKCANPFGIGGQTGNLVARGHGSGSLWMGQKVTITRILFSRKKILYFRKNTPRAWNGEHERRDKRVN